MDLKQQLRQICSVFFFLDRGELNSASCWSNQHKVLLDTYLFQSPENRMGN